MQGSEKARSRRCQCRVALYTYLLDGPARLFEARVVRKSMHPPETALLRRRLQRRVQLERLPRSARVSQQRLSYRRPLPRPRSPRRQCATRAPSQLGADEIACGGSAGWRTAGAAGVNSGGTGGLTRSTHLACEYAPSACKHRCGHESACYSRRDAAQRTAPQRRVEPGRAGNEEQYAAACVRAGRCVVDERAIACVDVHLGLLRGTATLFRC